MPTTPVDDTAIIIQHLYNKIDVLEKEKKDLKNELFRLKEDKAENEATYERVIASYKAKLDAIYANKRLLDEQEKTYENVISNLK